MAGRIIYLEVDDEITSAAARIRGSDSARIAVVLPYGSRVATSRINFRLLARDALTHDKRLSIVTGDPATRALAASAGLPVFASVAEYESAMAGADDEGPRPATTVPVVAATAAAAAPDVEAEEPAEPEPAIEPVAAAAARPTRTPTGRSGSSSRRQSSPPRRSQVRPATRSARPSTWTRMYPATRAPHHRRHPRQAAAPGVRSPP